MTNQAPIAEGLFTWPSDEPRLIGSRCIKCGTYDFPAQDGCTKCTSAETETVEFDRRGTLWTWTVQNFPPKSPPYLADTDPERFKPFGVGYVEIPGQVKVETRLTEADPGRLEIGMTMEMTIVPLAIDDDGTEIVTYAFEPAGDAPR